MTSSKTVSRSPLPSASVGETEFQELLQTANFGFHCETPKLIETHISWVLLTGEFAFKVKKRVKFTFVDYSTLAKRKHYCEKELELNRRFAPDLYLSVVPISLINNELHFEDDSNIVDYAVKMSQFDQSEILANSLTHPDLDGCAFERFGVHLATLHDQSAQFAQPRVESEISQKIRTTLLKRFGIESSPTMGIGPTPGDANQVSKDAKENISFLLTQWRNSNLTEPLRRLELWTSNEIARLTHRFRSRKLHGFIRRCHGDMHLNNLLFRSGEIAAFDGIEFNENFQFVDTASDLAFPLMDLVAFEKSAWAFRLLNSYIETARDFELLDVIQFYIVYRALVRAKVTWMNPENHTNDLHREAVAPWLRYLNTALSMAQPATPFLAITHGLSGSGKSTRALEYVENQGAIRLRSDVVRNWMPSQGSEKYSDHSRTQVYRYLRELATRVLNTHHSVIVDATFLAREHRRMFEELAKTKRIPFKILNCDAAPDVLRQRLSTRTNDPSEANLEVLDWQLANRVPLTISELEFVE